LALNGNRIRKIENIKHLTKLACLNLQDNLIEDFDPEEIPNELVILNLANNPCTKV